MMMRPAPILTAAWRSHIIICQTRSHFISLRRYASRRSNHNELPPYIKYGFIIPMTGLAMGSVYAYYSCLDYAPYTNRKRLICTNPKWEQEMGHKQYKELLQKFKGDILPADHRASVTVQRVGSRIAAAAQSFSAQYGQTNDTTNATTSPYTYTVVRSPEANAFVIPGNHVFVLTGLFRYAHNEDDLASVLGHEMAHNLARHAGERVSESILMTILSRLVLILDPTGILFTLLVPAQQLLVALPHSREHEVEADKIGIVLASEACYDPRSAKIVFSRMKGDGDKKSVSPPEFISTHPGYDTRLSYFDKWMPDALERYNKDGGNKCRAIREQMKRARKMAASTHNATDRRSR
eukprot:scaffold5796_cov98-Skeletonema_marinoi.AAC.7